jgi:hypothetical protein
VGDVLVDDDALDEDGVREGATDATGELDEIERDVFALEVGNGEDGVDGDLGKMGVVFGDTEGREGGVDGTKRDKGKRERDGLCQLSLFAHKRKQSG